MRPSSSSSKKARITLLMPRIANPPANMRKSGSRVWRQYWMKKKAMTTAATAVAPLTNSALKTPSPR
jgi:hypothetical protein